MRPRPTRASASRRITRTGRPVATAASRAAHGRVRARAFPVHEVGDAVASTSTPGRRRVRRARKGVAVAEGGGRRRRGCGRARRRAGACPDRPPGTPPRSPSARCPGGRISQGQGGAEVVGASPPPDPHGVPRPGEVAAEARGGEGEGRLERRRRHGQDGQVAGRIPPWSVAMLTRPRRLPSATLGAGRARASATGRPAKGPEGRTALGAGPREGGRHGEDARTAARASARARSAPGSPASRNRTSRAMARGPAADSPRISSAIVRRGSG